MNKGFRINAEEQFLEVKNQPDYGPIRRALFAAGSLACSGLAVAAFDVASHTQLLQGIRFTAFLFCAVMLVPTYTLAYRAWTGRR